MYKRTVLQAHPRASPLAQTRIGVPPPGVLSPPHPVPDNAMLKEIAARAFQVFIGRFLESNFKRRNSAVIDRIIRHASRIECGDRFPIPTKALHSNARRTYPLTVVAQLAGERSRSGGLAIAICVRRAARIAVRHGPAGERRAERRRAAGGVPAASIGDTAHPYTTLTLPTKREE